MSKEKLEVWFLLFLSLMIKTLRFWSSIPKNNERNQEIYGWSLCQHYRKSLPINTINWIWQLRRCFLVFLHQIRNWLRTQSLTLIHHCHDCHMISTLPGSILAWTQHHFPGQEHGLGNNTTWIVPSRQYGWDCLAKEKERKRMFSQG